jgi:GntR family transcriptional repressor for pyruvate dehydrogenase complex
MGGPSRAGGGAERATTDDLANLRAAIASLEKCKTQRERINAELEFHDALLKASGNRILRLLFRDVYRIQLTTATSPSKGLELDRSLGFHRRMYAAIKLNDAEGARTVMREHLAPSRKPVEAEISAD